MTASLRYVGSLISKQVVFADTLVSIVALAVVKISVVLFYKRIFISSGFRKAANAALVFIVSWMLALFIVSPKSAPKDLLQVLIW